MADMPKRQPRTIRVRGKTETNAWDDLGIGELERDRHVRSCLLCKALLFGCAAADDAEYLARAKEIIEDHREKSGVPAGTGCAYDGCVLHEEVSHELAHEMIRLGGGDKPSRDVRGVPISCIAFLVREEDHPEGFDMTRQDIVHRHFTHLKPAAGEVYIRFGPKKAAMHISVTPAYTSRREDICDPPTIEDILRVHEKSVPKIREWVMKKYAGLKELARLELGCADDRKA